MSQRCLVLELVDNSCGSLQLPLLKAISRGHATFPAGGCLRLRCEALKAAGSLHAETRLFPSRRAVNSGTEAGEAAAEGAAAAEAQDPPWDDPASSSSEDEARPNRNTGAPARAVHPSPGPDQGADAIRDQQKIAHLGCGLNATHGIRSQINAYSLSGRQQGINHLLCLTPLLLSVFSIVTAGFAPQLGRYRWSGTRTRST